MGEIAAVYMVAEGTEVLSLR